MTCGVSNGCSGNSATTASAPKNSEDRSQNWMDYLDEVLNQAAKPGKGDMMANPFGNGNDGGFKPSDAALAAARSIES